MRYLKVILLIILMTHYSCKQRSQEEKDCEIYEISLIYIEEYGLHDENKTYLSKDIEKNINILETISGTKSDFGLELLGKTRITDNDINNWRNWFNKNCSNSTDDSKSY